MFFKDTIFLLDTLMQYDSPFPTTKDTKREVFANVKSPTRQEFSATDSQGFRAMFVFEIREGEYRDEEYVEFHGKKYYVYRTFEKGFITEIYTSDQKASQKN